MESIDPSCTSIPNPITVLAWLPPDIASQYEAIRFFFAAVLGAWIWDVIVALPEDIRMFQINIRALSNIIYILARIMTGATMTTSFIFLSAPIKDCQRLVMINGWIGTFAIPLNSLLFLLRIKGVFYNSRPIVAIFGLLWLATFGACFNAPFTNKADHIGPTLNCTITSVLRGNSAGFIAVAVFDISVFLAITLRILTYGTADTWSQRAKSFWNGRHLGLVSRGLLKTGQIYYLATVWVNITVLILLFAPGISPVIRTMLSVPSVVLQNAMACKVFRLLKLGLIDDDPTKTLSGLRFKTASDRTRSAFTFDTTTGSSRTANDDDDDDDVGLSMISSVTAPTKHGDTPLPLRIAVRRDVENDAEDDGSARRDWKRTNLV